MPARNNVAADTDNAEEEDVGVWEEQAEWVAKAPTAAIVEGEARECFTNLLRLTKNRECSFFDFEKELVPAVFTLGRLLLALFLCRRHEDLCTVPSERIDGQRYERRVPQGRWLGTFFGKVRYWRTYMHAPGGGYYPLDRALGLPTDGFSTHLTGLMARLATKLRFATARVMLRSFLSWAPSTTTLEHAVLGLGRRTQAWFEQAPAPEDDGEILVIEIDGKSPPTATAAELQKRRAPLPVQSKLGAPPTSRRQRTLERDAASSAAAPRQRSRFQRIDCRCSASTAAAASATICGSDAGSPSSRT